MDEKEKNLHENHRKRMRDKYRVGRDAMPDHELLEILLFTLLRRQNTNPIAHELITRFGSLSGVFDADEEALMAVEGVGAETAFLIKQIPYLWQRYESVGKRGVLLDSISKIAEYTVRCYRGVTVETAYVLLLDSSAKLLACHKLFEGTVDLTTVSARRLAELAFLHKASRLVLAHNHPGGTPLPSDDDVATTRYLLRALHPLNLELEEHIIVAGEAYCPIKLFLENRSLGQTERTWQRENTWK